MEQSTLSALLRRTRSAAKAVALPILLAGSATAASLFSPPAAQAVTTFTYQCIVGVDCSPFQHGDKLVTPLGFDFAVLPPAGIPPVPVTAIYTWIDGTDSPLNYSDDSWKIEVESATGAPFIGPFDLSYSYTIDIVDGPGVDDNGVAFDGTGWFFNDFQLGTDGTRDRTLTFKTVAADGETLDFECEISNLGTACDGLKAFLSDAKTVTVTDRVNMLEGPPASLTSVSNTWTQRPGDQVPGPLPILGAGVAFGYSRRLRRRISNAETV